MCKRLSMVLVATAVLLKAQETTATRPSFEVASVKVSGAESKRDTGGGPGSSDPVRYHFNSATLRDLIAAAYNLQFFQILSKIALDQQRFDILAKVPEGASRDQFREMMQGLLAERFHLRLHRESREFPAWNSQLPSRA